MLWSVQECPICHTGIEWAKGGTGVSFTAIDEEARQGGGYKGRAWTDPHCNLCPIPHLRSSEQ